MEAFESMYRVGISVGEREALQSPIPLDEDTSTSVHVRIETQ